MILQIMPYGTMAVGFAEFTKNRIEKDVCFILIRDHDSNLDQKEFDGRNETTRVIDSRVELLSDSVCRKWIKDSEAIIVNWVDGVILSLLSPFLSKTALLFWGGDLHSFKKGLKGGFFQRACKKAIGKLIERAVCIITLLPGDYDELCAVCEPRGKWFLGAIMTSEKSQIKIERSARSQSTPRRILVGNSSTRTNRHKEAFELLSRYKNEDIEVCVPLSYGDDAYRSEVLEEGGRIFGEKFKPLLQMMEAQEYLDFLGTIAVGVFNHNRQQGMGNIQRLLAYGAKVYVSQEGPMLKDFTDEGFCLYPTESIRCLEFEDFLAMDESDRMSNNETADFANMAHHAVELWSEIYRYLRSLQRSHAES